MEKNDSLKIRTGAELKIARKNAGYTMLEVAGILGVTRETVTRMESGNMNLTLETIEKFCTAIHMTPSVTLEPMGTKKRHS